MLHLLFLARSVNHRVSLSQTLSASHTLLGKGFILLLSLSDSHTLVASFPVIFRSCIFVLRNLYIVSLMTAMLMPPISDNTLYPPKHKQPLGLLLEEASPIIHPRKLSELQVPLLMRIGELAENLTIPQCKMPLLDRLSDAKSPQ